MLGYGGGAGYHYRPRRPLAGLDPIRSAPLPPLPRILLLLVMLTQAGCAYLNERFPADWLNEREAPASALDLPPVEPIDSNAFVLASPAQSVIGEVQVILARDSDTFSDIARSYGLGYDELVDANPGVDPWIPGEGTPIVLPTQFVLPDAPREGIVLNIAAKRLFYYPAPSEAERESGSARVITYPIGIGRVGWATPTGSASVVAKATDPAWYVPASVRAEHRAAGDPLPAVVPPGPDNPLGRHVLKLDMPGYLLHGTNQPYGVGMRVSHGCVRLYPENIEALYAEAGIGTPVHIVNQPVLAGFRERTLYVEAHPKLEDDERETGEIVAGVLQSVRQRHGELRDDGGRALLDNVVAAASGIPVPAVSGAAPRLVHVHNLTTEPEEGPTREEVAALIEEAVEEARLAEAGVD
jgi:L,D-transpeptidase ErfK/SrfK